MIRLLEVILIVLPVFAIMALGKALVLTGLFNTDRQRLVNAVVYYIALPALIFNAVARQSASDFLHLSFWAASLLPLGVVGLIFAFLARKLGYVKGRAAVFVFGTFWANVTYMGLPLSLSAFGERGLQLAAVYNAVCMPLYVVMGFLVIAGYVGRAGSGLRFRGAFLNPIVGSALLGVLVVWIRHVVGKGDGFGPFAIQAGHAVHVVLDRVGRVGLPLALMSIGASLVFKTLSENWLALSLTIMGKLILLPLAAFLIFRIFFPDASTDMVGVVVLLSGMPNAVASYVVACQLGLEEDFVASLLVAGTCASVVTIPLWLYILI